MSAVTELSIKYPVATMLMSMECYHKSKSLALYLKHFSPEKVLKYLLINFITWYTISHYFCAASKKYKRVGG